MDTAATPEAHYDPDGLHPNALHVLQSIYGLDETITGLTQAQAIKLAHGLTDTYFEHYPELEHQRIPTDICQERVHYIIQAFMNGVSVDHIATEIAYQDGTDVEIVLTDVIRRIREYNAMSSWQSEEIKQDYLNASDYDALDRALLKILEEDVDHEPYAPFSDADTTITNLELLTDTCKKKAIVNHRIDRKAEAARLAVELYSKNPTYTEAVQNVGTAAGTEIIVIHPSAKDRDAETLRTMAWLVHRAIFMEKDGTPMAHMRAYEDARQDYHMLTVRYEPDVAKPEGAAYIKKQVPGGMLPSVEAIETAWGQDIQQILSTGGLPCLRHKLDVMDVVTVGVLNQQGLALLGMYNALGRLSDRLRVRHFVTVFDNPALQMLNRYYEAFKRYAPEDIIPPMTYDAPRGEGVNRSLPLHCDIRTWKQNLDPRKLEYYFGYTLNARMTFTSIV